MFFMWMFGCGEVTIETQSLTLTCDENVDPEVSEIEWDSDGNDILIRRTAVFQAIDSVFAPEITIMSDSIDLKEFWREGEEDDTVICMSPTLRVINPPTGDYELWWYIEDEAISFDLIEFEVD